MANATGRDLHIDAVLSNIAINWKPSGLIADQIAPIIPVMKQSDLYPVFDKGDNYRTQDSFRAPMTLPARITRSVSSDNYFAKNYAFRDGVPFEDIANADPGWLITERGARTEYLTDRLLLDWEGRVSALVNSTSNVGSSSAVASNWSDLTNSDPIGDIETAQNNIQDATGVQPNSIIFGLDAWRFFRKHDNVISRLYGNQNTPGNLRMASIDGVKALFEVDRVLIGRGYQSTADEGQSAALAKIWGTNVLLYHAPTVPSKTVPSFMYSFRWNTNGISPGMQAKVFNLDREGGEEIHVHLHQDEKITAKELGFLITDVRSSV